MTSRSQRVAGLAAGGAILLFLPFLPLVADAAEAVTQPSFVAVAGDLNTEFGCGSDWAPDCDQAQMTRREIDDVWQLTADLPAGPFAYKAALDKSWEVNYGLNAAPGGANIPITVPNGGAKIGFFYDHATHWITDTLTAPIATAAGDFQSELGCPSDWSPDCLRSWLQDPDGDATYTFTTTALPAGNYQSKATLGMSWDVSYGQDGVPGGANIGFTVPADNAATTFSYDGPSHTLTVYGGDARPSLQAARAHWLSPEIIAWKPTGDPDKRTYQLGGAADGSLRAGPNGLTGGTTVPLTYDPVGMPSELRAKFPHLADLPVLRVPAGTDVAGLLRGQVAVAAIDAEGTLVDASSLQIPGVLDALYSTQAGRAQLGPVYRAGRPTLSVWAPTAQTAAVELFDSADDTEPTLVPMRRNDTTGVWTVTGDRTWDRKFYRYRVKVFAPAAMQVVTNSVTDPYSLALSTDSKLSQIVDLASRDLAPRGWSAPRPPSIPNTRQQIQELHIGDFSTEDTAVAAAERGSYLAFTDPDSAGMKHLRNLARSGVTTVHLLPTFDFGGVPENAADRRQPPCDLTSFPADSDQQQACIAKTQGSDDFNWGYNPLHYTAPEGSYATRPNGASRILQFRQMVQALHSAGLRVVLDVVYNHTAAVGQDPNSVLDRIVPGYYQRLSASGVVTTDSCCADTAPEHAMMNKLVVDSVTTWAKHYKIDGFRFDLMGLDPKQTMLDVQSSLKRLPGGDHFLYGEGWDYGVVANNARFVQATQANMAGTGIGTFNDRLRDAVRGGSVFDDNPRIQGFGNGLFVNPNGDPINGDAAEQRRKLLAAMDLIKIGLTGNLKDYVFKATTGDIVKGSQLVYDGKPAGYTAAPGEAVTYVDAHDNLALYDANAYKLPTGTTMADRARLQALALATTVLSQGSGFAQTGTDLLRSKSFDGNSYDSGDWFNAIHFDCRTGNGFGRGLPPGDSQPMWPYAKPLLADPALVPDCRSITSTTRQYQDFLRIKQSSPLFSLNTAAEVQRRVTFPLSGTDAEVPGVITQRLDGTRLRGTPSLTVIYNSTPAAQRQTIKELAGTRQLLHTIQLLGADRSVKQATYAQDGTFTVPAYTVAVFVQK